MNENLFSEKFVVIGLRFTGKSCVKKEGFSHIEPRGIDGVNINKLDAAATNLMCQKIKQSGIKVYALGTPIGKIKLEDDFNAHLDTLRHCLEVAEILGAKNLRLFSFYMPKDEDPTPYRNEVIDRMGAFLDVARGSGVLLCHENEKGIYGDIASRCLELHQALPELGGIFDPANYVQCGQDTLAGWELLKDHIHYLHIKDALADGSVVPAGKGIGNVPFIVKSFMERGGNACTMEPHLKVFDGLKALEESGNTSVVGGIYRYPDANTAFDAACDAMKEILKEV